MKWHQKHKRDDPKPASEITTDLSGKSYFRVEKHCSAIGPYAARDARARAVESYACCFDGYVAFPYDSESSKIQHVAQTGWKKHKHNIVFMCG